MAAIPGELRLFDQELHVGLGDGNWARVGSSVMFTREPPGPLIDVASGLMPKWTITNITVTAPFKVFVSGGPVTNTVFSTVNYVENLILNRF
jgi:hypothetical protein